MIVKFTIPGDPKAKSRPRYSSKSGKMYTDNKTYKYEKLVKESYGDNPSFEDSLIKNSINSTFLAQGCL